MAEERKKGQSAGRSQASKPKPKPKPPEQEPVSSAPVVRASARYVRTAPRKARLVADQVRGLHIEHARALLRFSSRGAARDIAKLIDSAAANAENNYELVADDMKIAEINVDEGPTLRRWRPRALGRATRINRRTSHISVALTPEEEE
jgi:ribosomal protein L22